MAKSQAVRLSDAIAAYYATLKEFEFQHALHEGAVSVAFQTLLAEAARPHKWTLIPQLSENAGGGGKGIRPDGTLKDWMNLPRGHWEAKDTKDDLDAEIAKKMKKGYPLGNIIFEDTRRAVLFQNKQRAMDVDLRDPAKVADLLKQYFAHVEPQIESFEEAVDESKKRCCNGPPGWATGTVRRRHGNGGLCATEAQYSN